VRQAGTNEIIFVEDCSMLNEIIKLCQKSILNKLCLKETSFVNWTIEESLETNIPKEV